MKEIILLGMVLLLTGCSHAISGEPTVDPIKEGWFSREKTEQQLSQDLDQCKTRCVSA